MEKSTLLVLKILAIILIFNSCVREKKPIRNIEAKKSTTDEEMKINKVNFYFENSGSMNGYLNGDKFRVTMGEILHNIEDDSLHSFFVNTNEYKADSILDKIRGGKSSIKTQGIGNSDHKFIFKNAINNSTNNNLSIVVTDGIYSMQNGNMSDVEVDIKDAFENALKVNEIETVVLKMSSNFNGTYYTESNECENQTINQERPYYVLLFGNKEIINKALEEIVVIEDLNGYNEQARFFITKRMKVDYSILTKGEEKKGSFKAKGHSKLYDVKEIEDPEKFQKNGIPLKDRYLQFGIAVDYSNLSIPSNYLINTLNYSVEDNTGYKVVEIKTIENIAKSSISYKWIENLNKKGEKNFTHIIVVRAKTQLYNDLKINLIMNFPKWIIQTGTKDDCDIKNDSNTTFAFDRLMSGISKAYKKVNAKENFFKLKININP